jgi:hypothetical protein
MSDECGAMNAGHGNARSGRDDPADGLRLTAYGQDADEMRMPKYLSGFWSRSKQRQEEERQERSRYDEMKQDWSQGWE